MEFEPSVTAVEATRVVHDGALYVLATVDGRVHCLDNSVFDLLFKPCLLARDKEPVEDMSFVAARELPRIDPEPPAQPKAFPLREKMAEACIKEASKKGKAAPNQQAWAHGAPPADKPKVSTEPKDLLDAYPTQLHHPAARTQRAVWLCLKEKGPADLSTLCDRLEIETSVGASALFSMQQKGVVQKPEKTGGAWRVV